MENNRKDIGADSNGDREKALQKSDSSGYIATDPLNRAASLVESELNAVRFFKDEKAWAPPPPAYGSLRDYIRVFFRHKGVLWATFFAVMGSVLVGLQFMTPVYEARVKMLISGEKQVQAPYYREIGGYRNAPIALTQSEVVNTYPI